jgi:hypothetical protein
MFDDVSAVFGTGRFLPYDKDRRWFDHKSEAVPSWLCRLAGLLCPCLLHHKAVQADANGPLSRARPAPARPAIPDQHAHKDTPNHQHQTQPNHVHTPQPLTPPQRRRGSGGDWHRRDD